MSAGLVTEPGDFSRAEGALLGADNCDLSTPGIIAKRRGASSLTLASFSNSIYSAFSSPALEAVAGTGAVLLATGAPNGAGYSGLRFGTRGNATFTAFTGVPVSILSRRARLVTGPDGVDVLTSYGDTEQGPVVLDYAAAAWRRLGLPRGMGLDRQNTTFPAGTMLLNAYSVRYAVVFVLGDPMANGAQFGSPAMTSVVSNTSGATADVATRVLLPKQFGTTSTSLTADAYWVQVYRSQATLTSTGEPPSELALVYQKQITAADIAAGYVAFTDATPDSLRGANLYTNLLTGEDGFAGRGFVNSNEPPPIGSDLALFADCLWLSELQDWSSQEVQLIAVGGTGLVAADTVTLGGKTLTAVAAAPGVDQFAISGGGTASVNQRETALNLVDAINRTATAHNCWAYYVAGQAGLPGRIILRGRLSGTSIGFTSSRLAAWRIGTESTEATLNGLAFSKPLQPSAWPVVNRFQVGRGEASIQRIITFRDSLFVFKDDGVWRVTGDDYASFRVNEFDLTFRLAGRECVVAADDAIYAWGTQGIARIDEGGLEYIDLPIRSQIVGRQLASSRFATYAFAVARQYDGAVLFCAPDTDGGGSTNLACGDAYVWHVRTRRWSRWDFANESDSTIGYSCAVANVNDSMLSFGVWQAAPATGCFLHTELRTLTSADFRQPDISNHSSPSGSVAVILALGWGPLGDVSPGGRQWIRLRASCANSLAWGGRTAPTSLSCYVSGLGVGSFPFSAGDPAVAMLPPQLLPGWFIAPVPQDVARSPVVYVALQHSTIDEGVWLVAAAVDYRSTTPQGVGR